MTQLGEAVAIGMVDADDVGCPFEHDNLKPPKNGENKLVGKGGTLARKLESGATTKLRTGIKVDPIPNPKKRRGHPFFGGAACVLIEVVQPEPPRKRQRTGDRTSKPTPIIKEYMYRVSCAAHHCIPAQESLKESPLLAYMVKKGDDEELKDETYSTGLVWADVEYDVNGSENGVWLPGNYAVCGSRNGSLWQSEAGDDSEDDEELEDLNNAASDYEADSDPAAGAAASSAAQAYKRMLQFDEPIDDGDDSNVLIGNGGPFSARPDSRKWRYVAQAMMMCPGQFHDRHEAYSSFVAGVLRKIFDNYLQREKKNVTQGACKKCADRKKEIDNAGTPTPFALVDRLNGVSRRMNQMLAGGLWPENVFTSKWVRSYLDALKRGGVKPKKLDLVK